MFVQGTLHIPDLLGALDAAAFVVDQNLRLIEANDAGRRLIAASGRNLPSTLTDWLRLDIACASLSALLQVGKLERMVAEDIPSHTQFHLQVLCSFQSQDEPRALIKLTPLAGSQKGASPPFSIQDLSALLADDDPISVMAARAMIQHTGLSLDTVTNGRDAVSLAAQKPYALIFMDIQMPEVDGVAATLEIRRQEKRDHRAHTPIIALTAYGISEMPEHFSQAGFDDYIEKPLHPSALRKTLLKYLGGGTETSVTIPPYKHSLDAVVFQERKHSIGDGFDQFIQLYLNDSEKHLALLEDAILGKRFSEVDRMAHSLRSAAEYIGAQLLSALAIQIEKKAQTNSTYDLDILLKGFKRELSAVRAELARSSPA